MIKKLSFMWFVGSLTALQATQEVAHKVQIKVQSSPETFVVIVADGTRSFRYQEFGNTTWLPELANKVEKSSGPYKPSSMAAYATCALKEVFVPGFTEAYAQCQDPRERAEFLKKGCHLVYTLFHDDDFVKDRVRACLGQDFSEHQDSWINHLMDVSILCHRCLLHCGNAPHILADDPDENLNLLHKSIMEEIGYSSSVAYHWPFGTTSNHCLVRHKDTPGIDFGSLFGLRFD